ncbi:MAG: DUF11 domain-containing protein [Solirubrobacteraceae bacterium]
MSPRSLLAPATALLILTGATSASAATTADLASNHSSPPEHRTVGSTATYEFAVSNNGPEATEATLTDHLGAAEELVSITTDKGSCTQTAPATCALGTLEPGGLAFIKVTVKLVRTGLNEHSDVMTGPADNRDPDPSNDADGVSYTVGPAGSTPGQTPRIATGHSSRRQASFDADVRLNPYGTGTYYFQYGRTAAYGQKTDATKIHANDEVKRTETIDGLKMDTTYHYRAVLVVDGKTYRGKDETVTTLGKLLYGPLTIKPVDRGATSTVYSGLLGDHLADAPGACSGEVTVDIYLTSGADITHRTTRLKSDCTYRITMPIGSQSARKYGPKGSVLVQANFEGNRAVARVGSESDRP